MQILKLFALRILNDETEGVTFDRVLKVLSASGYSPEKIRFRFEDHPESAYVKRVSAVERAIKAYPAIGLFRGEIIQQWNNNQRLVVLSNFHAGSSRRELHTPAVPETAVPPAMLSEILHGIPRRFPFWHATVLFDDIQAFNLPEGPVTGDNETLNNHDLTGPGVILQSNWWTSRRMRGLEAVVAVPVPKNDQSLALSSPTEELISTLGKVAGTELKLTPSPSDRVRIEAEVNGARVITARYKKDPFAGVPGTVLPHPLPVPGQHFGVALIDRRQAGIPSVKELLKQEFQPLAYRYRSNLSGQGCYTLQKKSSQNYVLSISVDVSPIGGQFCSSFFVCTPQGSFGVPVQLPPFGNDYPVNEHLPLVVKNAAFVIQKLEETYVAELEAVLGRAPRWFADANISK